MTGGPQPESSSREDTPWQSAGTGEGKNRQVNITEKPRITKPERGTKLLSETMPAMPEPAQPLSAGNQSVDSLLYEILVMSESVQIAEAERLSLLPLGLTIKKRKLLKGLGRVLTVYRFAAQTDPHRMLEQAQQRLPIKAAELNQRYFLQGSKSSEPEGYHASGHASAKQYARHLVGITGDEPANSNLYIGMLDAAVNRQHPALIGADLSISDVTGIENKPTRHGTAVASLLVGRNQVQSALPGAHLLAINIFSDSEKGRQHTRTDWWLLGLNELAKAQPLPSVVNMSFGGGYSHLVEGVIDLLISRGVTMVAAVGNDGPESGMMFPASHKQVIGATAVDIRKQLYRRAPVSLRGPALAGPGVDVWAADEASHGFYASGTSFASPWVTAMVALAKTSGLQVNQVLEAAEDLGPPGYDPQFGSGLVKKL